MTSEVLVMNSMAVVLAADSALTRRSSNPNIQHYSNGGNKIFSLSTAKRANIGIMVYNSVDICGAPWELLIKSFRHENNGKTFKTVKECSDKFFKFINENKTLMSNKIKKETFDQRFIYILIDRFSKKNPANKHKDEFLNNFKTNKENQPELDTNQESHFRELFSNYSQSVKTQNENKSEEEKLVALDEDLCILIFKAHLIGYFDKYLSGITENYTGIVISGFGEDEEFPACIETICYGISPYKLSLEEKTKYSITGSNQASIQGFAQDEMIRLLLNRFDEKAFEIITDTFKNEFYAASKKLNICQQMLDIVLTNSTKKSIYNHNTFSAGEFRIPLINSISAMSISELSTLAGTFVELEALNEKLSRPSKSVGGPIDIISITKNEGLIWIKRKHYFESELNPEYFKNLQ